HNELLHSCLETSFFFLVYFYVCLQDKCRNESLSKIEKKKQLFSFIIVAVVITFLQTYFKYFLFRKRKKKIIALFH
ncbi:hypothetical protein BY458DRAFT_591629, partial [Sporodiniella umbellata]